MLGLSICQELALDEDEEEQRDEEKGDLLVSSLLQSGEVQTPVQLSNVLMKALKVGRNDKAVEQTSTPTKNQDEERKTR